MPDPPTIHTNLPPIGIQLPGDGRYYTVFPYWLTVGGYPGWWHGYPPYYGQPPAWSSWQNYWTDPNGGSPPLVEAVRRVVPPTEAPRTPAPAALPGPPPDPGLAALRSLDYAGAVLAFEPRALDRVIAESVEGPPPPPDRSAQRLLGLALVGVGRLAEAEAVMTDAYAHDPGLFLRPLDALDLLGSSAEVRRLVNSCVARANRENTRDAWFSVAILMQAEGREAMAQRMFRRAADLRFNTQSSPPPSRGDAKPAVKPKAAPEQPAGPASFRMPGP